MLVLGLELGLGLVLGSVLAPVFKDHPKKSQVEFTIWASADGSIIGVIWVPHGHMCHNGDSQSQSIIYPIRNRLMHNFRDLGPSGHIFSGIVLFCKYCKY